MFRAQRVCSSYFQRWVLPCLVYMVYRRSQLFNHRPCCIKGHVTGQMPLPVERGAGVLWQVMAASLVEDRVQANLFMTPFRSPSISSITGKQTDNARHEPCARTNPSALLMGDWFSCKGVLSPQPGDGANLQARQRRRAKRSCSWRSSAASTSGRGTPWEPRARYPTLQAASPSTGASSMRQGHVVTPKPLAQPDRQADWEHGQHLRY